MRFNSHNVKNLKVSWWPHYYHTCVLCSRVSCETEALQPANIGLILDSAHHRCSISLPACLMCTLPPLSLAAPPSFQPPSFVSVDVFSILRLIVVWPMAADRPTEETTSPVLEKIFRIFSPCTFGTADVFDDEARETFDTSSQSFRGLKKFIAFVIRSSGEGI